MTDSSKAPTHPGTYVRESIIPSGMSVTEAAKRLGIGRPALSNFLNGKSALSPEMASWPDSIALSRSVGVSQAADVIAIRP
jgi:plasmid maintenance system antidote protein VapI